MSSHSTAARSRLARCKQQLKDRQQRPHTPYIERCHAWLELLARYKLESKYPKLCAGIRFGFDLGIPKITYTYAPPNYPSLERNTEEYEDILTREFESTRYVGPLTRQEVRTLIGPFQSSPLSVIPAQGAQGKPIAVQDFSYPRSPQPVPSINSSIDPSKFSSTSATFHSISFIISNLPNGSQASVRHVADAHRTVPAHPRQWPGLVVRLAGEDSFAIDTNGGFGLASDVYGLIADASLDIFRHSGIGPVSKRVGDYIFFRIPKVQLAAYNNHRARCSRMIQENGGQKGEGGRIWYSGGLVDDGVEVVFDEDCSTLFRDFTTRDTKLRPRSDNKFTYSDADIDRVSDALGIPWEHSMTIPFCDEVTFLGFEWRLSTKEVSLAIEKQLAYKEAVEEFLTLRYHTLADLRDLYGQLMHACLVLPSGRAYLTSVEEMMGAFDPGSPPSAQQPTTIDVEEDLAWWKERLSQPCIAREVPALGSTLPLCLEAYSDASSGTGIGISVGGQWWAWRLAPGWKAEGRDIAWAEAVGFELLAIAVARKLKSSDSIGSSVRHVAVYGGHAGTIQAWWNARSQSKDINQIIRRVHRLEAKHGVRFHARLVPGEDNPADKLSRGQYPSGQPPSLLSPLDLPVALRPYLFDWNSPYVEGAAPAVQNPHRNNSAVPKSDFVQDVETAQRLYEHARLFGETHRPGSPYGTCGPVMLH